MVMYFSQLLIICANKYKINHYFTRNQNPGIPWTLLFAWNPVEKVGSNKLPGWGLWLHSHNSLYLWVANKFMSSFSAKKLSWDYITSILVPCSITVTFICRRGVWFFRHEWLEYFWRIFVLHFKSAVISKLH